MRKYPARAAAAIALTAVFLTGSLTGCTLSNPFKTSAPEVIQDSAPAEVISEASAVTPAPAESPAELIAPTPTPTVVPTIMPQVLTPTPTPTPAPKVLGEESDAETTYKMLIENATGTKLIQLAVRVRSDGYDTATHLSESDPLEPDGRAELYYDASYAIKEAKQYGDIPEYQLRFTTEDGNYYVIHNLPFGEVDEIRLMLGNGYAYIVYTSKTDNKEVSTQESEREYAGVEDETSYDNSGNDNSGDNGEDQTEYEDNAGDDGNDNDGGSNDGGDYDGGNDDGGNDGGDNGGEDEGGDDGGDTYEDEVDTYEDEETDYNDPGYDEEGNIVG